MTERINHAAEALSYIQEAHDMTPTGYRKEAGTQHALQEAHVHATLALVEQQRIANLIAMHQSTFPPEMLDRDGWFAARDITCVAIHRLARWTKHPRNDRPA